MTEQTQALFFPTDPSFRLFSIFSVLPENKTQQGMLPCARETTMGRSSFCVCFSTCAESTHSGPFASIPSAFSLFLISGLAALISIFRLDVGVQGSTEPTSLPFLGVVRGPMTKRPLSPLKIDLMISLAYL